MSGFWSADIVGGGDIPDSVVDRPSDDSTVTDTDSQNGLEISTSQEWPKFQARISTNTSNLGTAYIYDFSDGSLVDSVDVSALSAGDVLTFDDAGLAANSNYTILGDNDGSTYDAGFVSSYTLPYASSDGNLEIVDGANGPQSDGADPLNFVEVGNINL